VIFYLCCHCFVLVSYLCLWCSLNSTIFLMFSVMTSGSPKKKKKSREKRSSSALPVMQSPKKHLKWTDQSMVTAMKAVVEESSSVNKAAREYREPRTTLQDRITGRVGHGTKPRPKLYLKKQKKLNWLNFL